MSVARPSQNLPPELQRRGSTTSPLTIPKRTGHMRTLRDVFVEAAASGSVDIAIGNVTLARIFHNLAQAVLIAGLDERHEAMGFLSLLKMLFPETPNFYAAQDEDITLTTSAAPTRLDAYFEDRTEGDVADFTKPGGSKGREHLFILNMSNAAAITADGTTSLTRQDMPTGLSLFTDATRMSANNRFTLYALAANVPVNVASKATAIHIFDEFTELFSSENNEGLFVDPTVANELGFDLTSLKMFKLPKPYIFEPNKVINMTITVDHDGANNLAIGTQQLFLIGKRDLLAPGGL